jgi:hypothetical protein
MVVSVVVSKRFLNDFKDLTDVINVMDELYYTTTTQEFNDFNDLAGEVHVMDELYYTTTTLLLLYKSSMISIGYSVLFM